MHIYIYTYIHIYIYTYIHIYIYTYIHIYIYTYIHIYIYTYIHIYIYTYLHIYIYTYIHIYIYTYIHIYIYTYPSIYLSIYPSIHLSIYPSIHLSIYLSIYLPIMNIQFYCALPTGGDSTSELIMDIERSFHCRGLVLCEHSLDAGLDQGSWWDDNPWVVARALLGWTEIGEDQPAVLSPSGFGRCSLGSRIIGISSARLFFLGQLFCLTETFPRFCKIVWNLDSILF